MIREHLPRLMVAAALLALAAAGCGRRQQGELIARVGSRTITEKELFKALERGENGDAGRRALDALIVQQLVRDEAEKRNIKADPKEVQRRMEGLKDYVLASTGKDFETWLKDTGQDEQEIASRIGLQMLTAKLVLTDEGRKKYFEDNKDRLKDWPHTSESVIWRHIVVASQREAEAVRKELVEGAEEGVVTPEQFAKLAEERSVDPMTRSRGGMVGWMIKGKSSTPGMEDPALEEALFALKPGEVSQPLQVTVSIPPAAEGQPEFKAPERWQIAMVDKHIEPHPITLEDNQDVIEEWMLNDPALQFQLQQFFENLRAKANIEVLAPRYRSIGEAYQQRQRMREQRMPQGPMGPALPEGRGRPGGPATEREGGPGQPTGR